MSSPDFCRAASRSGSTRTAAKRWTRKRSRNSRAAARTGSSENASASAATVATPANAGTRRRWRAGAAARVAASRRAQAPAQVVLELGPRLLAQAGKEIVAHRAPPSASSHRARSAAIVRCRIVPTFDSPRPVSLAMARLVAPAPYFKAISSRSRSGSAPTSAASLRRSAARSAPVSGVSSSRTTASSRGTSRPRPPQVVDRRVARDRHEPRGDARPIAPIAVVGPPGLLERRRGQVLGGRPVEAPVAQVVVDARQLLAEDLVPVDRVDRRRRGEPLEDAHTAHVAWIYGAGAKVSRRESRSPSPRARSHPRGGDGRGPSTSIRLNAAGCAHRR